ncbi:MAG TPA: cytochrome P450 [Thermoleophilaceae bacterium]|nr:cytochrome P450 [Thermoleophilaceae bacterium]
MTLPPGPRMPSQLQGLGWWHRPTAFLERCRAKYGKRFTVRLPGQPPFVMISDPGEVKELFTAPPEVLHPGEGARILEPIVGSHSVILLDEGPHLRQRRLLLPAFQGERMQELTGLMEDMAEREVAGWPAGRPVELHSRFQALTLEIILRAVFGLGVGQRLDVLRERVKDILDFGSSPASLDPRLWHSFAGFGPYAHFTRARADADELIYAQIDERRRSGERRGDVLSMLLDARHEDDTEMSRPEIRDELMTALVAGHETTASELAFMFERLAREPRVLARLHEEIDDDAGDEYLTATINETLRRRPVLPNAEPRLVVKPVEVGGWHYEPGVVLVASAWLMHHDPDLYPQPFEFRPERFLDNPPGTYTWIPFGGGRRRCIGANFALLEMKLTVRAALRRFTIDPPREPERIRRRAITISPRNGACTVLRLRSGPSDGPSAAPERQAPASAAVH